jgi:hypothetical protein
LIKQTLQHIIRDFRKPKFPLFWGGGEELPNDVGNVLPSMLSEGIDIKLVLHGFHQSRAATRTTFVNLHRDFTAPLVNRDYLMDDG